MKYTGKATQKNWSIAGPLKSSYLFGKELLQWVIFVIKPHKLRIASVKFNQGAM